MIWIMQSFFVSDFLRLHIVSIIWQFIIQWNLYKWGNLECFYSFPYKLTSLNGEVWNGGPKRLRNNFVHLK